MTMGARAVLALALVMAVATTMVAGLNFPQAYKANLQQLVEITPVRNMTWRNGAAAFNRQLLSAKLSGLSPNGISLTNLYLFNQQALYVIDNQQYCRREHWGATYSDPLDVARYTAYAGLINYQGRQVQQWSYSQQGVQISIYTTNDSRQDPVRLYFLQGGQGVLIEYTSFSSGSSSSDFQLPSSCGGHPASGDPVRVELRDPFKPIADFIAAHPLK